MIEIVPEHGTTVVALGARYDSLDEGQLRQLQQVLQQVAQQAPRPLVVVDMARTEFIGSSFVGLVQQAARIAGNRHGQLVLCNLRPFCAEVISVLGMSEVLSQYPNRTAAIAALTGAS